jgi:hypothetical protein
MIVRVTGRIPVVAIQLDGQVRIYDDLLSAAEAYRLAQQSRRASDLLRSTATLAARRRQTLLCSLPAVRHSAACRLPA